MTLTQLIAGATRSLSPLYGPDEARALARVMLEELRGWSPTDQIIRGDKEASVALEHEVETTLRRLLAHEPIQYIFHHARFYGLDFHVDSTTLIPRPDTELLVEMIVKENPRKDLRVLDLGTGTGCIALSLARHLAFADVLAVDFSEKVLEVARLNACQLHTRCSFVKADILNPSTLPTGTFDIIVSNPPYVLESEKPTLEPNVLNFEPHYALFVPDAKPLIYYEPIMAYAACHLCPGGRLYLEINPLCASQLVALAHANGFEDVLLHRDLSKAQRFLSAHKPLD